MTTIQSTEKPKLNSIDPVQNGAFDIAIGKSRKQLVWKNENWTWKKLLDKLSATHRTHETYAEYLNSKPTRQDEIKDIGGFVGGYLVNGKRRSGSILHRQLITLDIDFAKPGTWEDFTLLYNCAACIYSTHKHSP